MRGWTRACSVALLLLGGCSVAHLGTDTPSAPQIALGTDLVSVIDFVGGVQIPQPDGTVRAIGYEANVTVHVGSESSS